MSKVSLAALNLASPISQMLGKEKLKRNGESKTHQSI